MKKIILSLIFIFSIYGQAWAGITFDNTDDLVDLSSPTSLDNLAAITVSAWINPTAIGEDSAGRIFDKATATSFAGWGFALSLDNTTTCGIEFFVGYDGGTAFVDKFAANTTVTYGTWTHILSTWDGSNQHANAHIYKNGVEVTYGTGQDTNGGTVRDDESALSAFIGNVTESSRTFNGTIQEVAVWNTVLSAGDIANVALFREKGNSFGVFPSQFKKNFTLYFFSH